MAVKEQDHILNNNGYRQDNNFTSLIESDIEKNLSKAEPNNSCLLDELLQQIKPVDFQLLAFPDVKEWREKAEKLQPIVKSGTASEEQENELKAIQGKIKSCKVNKNHYLIIVTEQLLKVAKSNDWGLCKKNDFIYLYNGAYWRDLDKEEFQYFLGRVAIKMGVEKYKGKVYTFKEELYKQFMSDAYLPTPNAGEDAVQINLQNGTFEITSTERKLRGFNRRDFLTHQLPFEYDPEATAPMFQTYLDEVLPDKDKQKVLAEYLGYIFTRPSHLKLEKILILYGSGANGKSVMFDIIQALLGRHNVGNYSLSSLTNDNGYFRAKIANKLVNYASEINGRLESDVFKQLASGEPVEARLPYGQPFTLYEYAKLMFNCNALPYEVEHTNAFFRRFLIVHFDVTIPQEKKDVNLANKIIKHELSGVFNWILEGLERLLKQRDFTQCDAINNALSSFKKESDSVQMFLDEMAYKSDADNTTSLKDLYSEYRPFCFEDGYKAVNKSNFKKRLAHHKIQVERKSEGWVAYVTKKMNKDAF